MARRPLGIGIIGTGFGGQVQLPGFMGIADARVIGIASRDAERSLQLSKNFGLPRTFESVEALIACPEIDLVSVTLPPFAQAPAVRAAIAAGKAVLCEKPFMRDAQEAAAMEKLATEAHVFHAVDFEFRDLPSWQLLKKELERGSIGTVQRAAFSWMVGSWADPDRPWRWSSDKASGGGIVGSLGTHLFDAAEWFLGSARRVRATTEIAIRSRPDDGGRPKPVTAEDRAHVELLTAKDCPLTVELSMVEQHPTGLTMEFLGDRGTLRLESDVPHYGRALRVLRTLDGKKEVLLKPEDIPEDVDARIPLFERFAKRVVEALARGDTAFEPSFHAGVRSTMLKDAALASKGEWQNLAE